MPMQRRYTSQPKHKRLADVINQKTRIKRSKTLSSLLAHAQSTATLSQRLDECLPSKLVGRFVVAGLNNGQLTLHCNSAAVATRFRMEQDKILTALQMRIGKSKVSSFHIQIRPLVLVKDNKMRKKIDQKKEYPKGDEVEDRLENALERLKRRSSE